MAVAFECLRGPTAIIGDCLNVVKAFTAGARRALAPTRKYAGLVMSSWKKLDARRAATVRWTKAHRKETGRETTEEAADIRGNAAADAAAGEAIAIHPPLGADVEAIVDYHVNRIPHVVKAVTTAMAFFPPAPKHMAKAPRPETMEEARAAQRHLWQWRAGAWRCAACGDYVTRKTVPEYRLRQQCSGATISDRADRYATLGHTLVRASSDLPIIMCTHCGAWGNRRARRLNQPCGAPTSAGTQAVKRLMRGLHPTLQKDTAGHDVPRAPATITEAYDATTSTWVGFSPGVPAVPPPPLPAEPVDYPHPADLAAEHDDDGNARHVDSEEDVFGHGGALDQEDGRGLKDGCTMAAAESLGAGGAAEAHRTTTGGAASKRRRPAESATPRHIDYTAAAIARLGQSLRRVDTDAEGRMRNLRRRIAERSSGGDGPMTTRDDRPAHDLDRQLQGCKRTVSGEEIQEEGDDASRKPRRRMRTDVLHGAGDDAAAEGDRRLPGGPERGGRKRRRNEGSSEEDLRGERSPRHRGAGNHGAARRGPYDSSSVSPPRSANLGSVFGRGDQGRDGSEGLKGDRGDQPTPSSPCRSTGSSGPGGNATTEQRRRRRQHLSGGGNDVVGEGDFGSRGQLLSYLRGSAAAQAMVSTSNPSSSTAGNTGGNADPPWGRGRQRGAVCRAAARDTLAVSDGSSSGSGTARGSSSATLGGGGAVCSAAAIPVLAASGGNGREAAGSTNVMGKGAVRLSVPAVAEARDDVGATPSAAGECTKRRRLRGKQQPQRQLAGGESSAIHGTLMATASCADHPRARSDDRGPG